MFEFSPYWFHLLNNSGLYFLMLYLLKKINKNNKGFFKMLGLPGTSAMDRVYVGSQMAFTPHSTSVHEVLLWHGTCDN